jgi:hypothetical protein
MEAKETKLCRNEEPGLWRHAQPMVYRNNVNLQTMEISA